MIPRGDNQSTRGMDLLVVSQLRFLGPVPFHTTAFPGQFPLQSFPMQDGPPEKKFHLESGLDARDRARHSVSRTQVSAFKRHKTELSLINARHRLSLISG